MKYVIINAGEGTYGNATGRTPLTLSNLLRLDNQNNPGVVKVFESRDIRPSDNKKTLIIYENVTLNIPQNLGDFNDIPKNFECNIKVIQSKSCDITNHSSWNLINNNRIVKNGNTAVLYRILAEKNLILDGN